MQEKKSKKQTAKPKEKPKGRNPHTEELVDHYWGSMNHVTSLIKASELKAGLILSFYGILLNFIYQGTGTLLETISNDTLLYVFVGSWAGCTAVSVFFCVRCFIPRIEGKYSPNVFFFGDVTSKFGNIKQFAKTFYEISLDEQRLFEQLGEQIFIISKIAGLKFKNVKRAIFFLALSLLTLFIAATYYGILFLM